MNKYMSFKESYRNALKIAGENKNEYNKSLIFYGLAFTMQGLLYLSIYQLLSSMVLYQNHSNFWLIIIVGLLVGHILFKWQAYNFDYSKTKIDIAHNLRVRLGEKLSTMPLERFNRFKTGDLNSTFSSNVEESLMMLGMVSGLIMEIAVTAIVVIIGMLFIDFRIGILIILVSILAYPIYKKKRMIGVNESKNLSAVKSSLESNLIEYVQGITVLRATNQTGKNAYNITKGINKVKTTKQSTIWKTTLNLVLANMLLLFVLILTAFLGYIWVQDGSMSIIKIASVLVIVSRLMDPVSMFLALTGVLDVMDSGFSKVNEILETEELEVHKCDKAIKNYSISFEDVHFQYENQDEKVMNGMTIEFKEKSMNAIVGPSGSGKSTMTKLLMRHADPQKGHIKIGHKDIRCMTQEELMRNFSVVFQDVYLFNDSILENIRITRPDASDDEVISAAKMANCHNFIMDLPEQYNSNVGDIGGSLSGGERQRISIARSLLKDAPIVILDEPTSALDAENEWLVQDAISRLVENKTVIVIAHRLSTISVADQIIVIDDGHLVESGNHKILWNRKGKYYEMWAAQSRAKEWSK